jgi:polysaccharide biosynthesis/export protein
MKAAPIIQILIVVFLLAGLSGCFPSKAKDIEAFIKPYQVEVNAKDYVLHPPDEIEIHCTKIPEINGQRQQIRPDGKIAFETVGEIEAAGKTPQQMAAAIKAKAAEKYNLKEEKEPVEVRVMTYRSKLYYVVGEVAAPGPKIYTGRNTLLTAINEANPQVTGWEKHIQVVRPSADPEVPAKIFEVNYKDMYIRGDTSKNVLLQEGDIIYVPPTPLAAVAMVIEEFARPIGRALAPVYQVTQITTMNTAGGY